MSARCPSAFSSAGCCWQLAGTGALAAAILLPLYYLADATITLLRRLARREKVWEAHRSHFYQQATVNGFSVMAVSAHVFGLNLALAALAALDHRSRRRRPCRSRRSHAGCILVGWLLRRFATKQHPEQVRMNGPLIALTGATGFIGRHLVADLPKRGYRVRVLLRRPAEVPEGATERRHRRYRVAAQHGGGPARRGCGHPFGGPCPRHVGHARGRLSHHQHARHAQPRPRRRTGRT